MRVHDGFVSGTEKKEREREREREKERKRKRSLYANIYARVCENVNIRVLYTHQYYWKTMGDDPMIFQGRKSWIDCRDGHLPFWMKWTLFCRVNKHRKYVNKLKKKQIIN